MRKVMRVAVAAVIVAASLTAASSQQGGVDPGRVDAVVKSAFPTAPAEWQARLTPDETMRQCSAHHNSPPAAVARAIQERERAAVIYPADGKLIGDWRKGEALAQSGYGLRFTDYPPRRVNGGNCYACHQISRQEVSYGTLGPSLLGYGKQRGFGEAEVKAVYDRIYNPHAVFPCSNMPRFGSNKILTIEQIKDAVALLMSPDSPVNE
jgi:sulfur-oxidizing protein SoxX